jgi:hypothetical protein
MREREREREVAVNKRKIKNILLFNIMILPLLPSTISIVVLVVSSRNKDSKNNNPHQK